MTSTMIFTISTAVLILGSITLIILAFIDCLLDDIECKHEKKAHYESRNKDVCIDCGKEFSTKK